MLILGLRAPELCKHTEPGLAGCDPREITVFLEGMRAAAPRRSAAQRDPLLCPPASQLLTASFAFTGSFILICKNPVSSKLVLRIRVYLVPPLYARLPQERSACSSGPRPVLNQPTPRGPARITAQKLMLNKVG